MLDKIFLCCATEVLVVLLRSYCSFHNFNSLHTLRQNVGEELTRDSQEAYAKRSRASFKSRSFKSTSIMLALQFWIVTIRPTDLARGKVKDLHRTKLCLL